MNEAELDSFIVLPHWLNQFSETHVQRQAQIPHLYVPQLERL